MPRTVSTVVRQQLESNFSDDLLLIFLTISHPTLFDPIRVVNNNANVTYGGNTFIGFPFEITIMTDDDQPPKAQLAIQNLDPRIGDVIRAIGAPPRLKIEVVTASMTGSSESLLLHFEGVDGATTTTDSGANNHTVTFNSNAQIDTGQFKFGSSSLLLAGGTDHIRVDNTNGDFTWSGDFTYDFWFRLTSGSNANFYTTGDDALHIYSSSGTNIQLFPFTPSSGTLAQNTWHHGALVRFGTTLKLFANGVSCGTDTSSATFTPVSGGPYIGRNPNGAQVTNGNFDEIRCRKGEAVWTTSDFTPPTSPYGGAATVGTTIYTADKLFLTNVKVDIMSVQGDIVGWDYLQRTWPGVRARQDIFPGLFR